MSKKAVNKKEEQEIRSDYDEKQYQTTLGRYDRLIMKLKEAQVMTFDSFWIRGFKERSKRRDDAWKCLKTFLDNKPEQVQVKEQLKEFNSSSKNLKDAIEDLNEYVRDAIKAVEELDEFLASYYEAPLFKKEFPLKGDYNLKTGAVTTKKRLK